MSPLQLIEQTWLAPMRRSLRQASWGERLRGLAMFLGFAAFLGLLFGIFKPILSYFWAQPEIGALLTRSLVYFVFLSLTVLTAFSAVIAMSSRLFVSPDADFFVSSPYPMKDYFRFRAWQAAIATSWMLIPFWGPLLLALRYAMKQNWLFVIWSLQAPVPLAWLACSAGLVLVMATARRAPAKKIRNAFGAALALMVVALVLLLRIIQPERLTRPDSAVTLEQFLRSWTPDPHWWDLALLASNSVLDFPERPLAAAYSSMLLWILAWAAWNLLCRYGAANFLETWHTAREQLGGPSTRSSSVSWIWRNLEGRDGLLWLKEASGFWRNPAQRFQLVLVSALTLIFVYNLYRLPFQDDPSLRSILFLPACAFAQLILISVSTRFIFPSESLEANGSWLLRASPLAPWAYMRSRLLNYVPPLWLLNTALILSCIQAFEPPREQAWVALSLMIAAPLGIVALSAGLGMAWKQDDATHPEELTTSPAGVLVMLLCLAYVLAQLGIAGLVLRELQRQRLALWTHLNLSLLGFCGGTWLMLQFFSVVWPLKMAVKRMEDLG